jgi:hypothetical protein
MKNIFNKIISTKVIFVYLIITITGCSSHKSNQIPERIRKLKNLTAYPADTKPKETISFYKDKIYGSSKKITIGKIGAIAVDGSGRVFMADEQKRAIDVFKPGGRFLKQLGDNGKGPGEFSSIANLQVIGNHLYVYDENQLKESVFTLHPLAFDNTITLAGNRDNYPSLKGAFPFIEKLYVRNNNTYLAEFLSSVISRNRHNPQKYP